MTTPPNPTDEPSACRQCGEDAMDFREGVCTDCWQMNQDALDLHNARHDRWQRMTPEQRDNEIRSAR